MREFVNLESGDVAINHFNTLLSTAEANLQPANPIMVDITYSNKQGVDQT